MIDINNSIIKVVRSLAVKKYRDQEGLFVAEGTKCVRDTWGAFDCRWLICTRAWHDRMANASMYDKIVIASNQHMSRMSQFSNPSDVIAVYRLPDSSIDSDAVENNLNIVLDNIQDPGNLGTIMRLADWYGITNVFASIGTVDVFNHKTVQATMGAISRVMPVWGTFLDGENIYATKLDNKGFVVFGNEGRGISSAVAQQVTSRLLIPAWPHAGRTSESLNVGIAAAITISEFRRNNLV